MQNNTEKIHRYLDHEMSATEKSAFENQLETDEGLRDELRIQRQILHAIHDAGIKQEFKTAIKSKTTSARVMKGMLVIVAGIVAFTIFWFKDSIFSSPPTKGNLLQPAAMAAVTRPFVAPPLLSANVPFSQFEVMAEKGDTLFHSSGSIIYFPPSAFLDEMGKAVQGLVNISYREFSDPLDFFVSGIPMGYDSAGVKYNFESSGMCEILAYKNGKPVYVNKNANPEINLSVTNKSPLHNLYVLDTVSRQWNYMGKDIITEVKNTTQKNPVKSNLSLEDMLLPAKPLPPEKASGDKPAFSIEIDPGSFEELFAYDRLKFQVEDESSYNPADAGEHWDNVSLAHTSTDGIYAVTFTNAKGKVSYKVRPVLEGADYDAALKVFKKKSAKYEEARKNRIVRERADEDSITARNTKIIRQNKADRDWNDKLNALINARNKWMRDSRERQIKEQQSRTNEESLVIEQSLRSQVYQQLDGDVAASTEIVRSFSVNSFGVWNCDHPQYPQNETPLIAKFTDEENISLHFMSVAVVYGGFNGLTHFYSPAIRVIPGRQNMLWALKDSTFHYFTYQDFEAAKIDRSTREFTFRLRTTKKTIRSYNGLKELVGKL